LVREYLPHATVLVDTYDVHFVRQLREAKLKNDAELMAQAQQTMRRELAVYRQADFVITVTEADAAALRERVPALQTFVVPTIHALPEQVAGRDGRRDLLFVGGFSHVPNVDAVLYFCREVLPLILAEDPELCLHVVGNAPPAEIISLGSRNIRIWGYVPYLNPFLQQALVSVAPLRFGSGMKGKIAEAMSYGLPVVTTTIGAEGMNLQDGEDTMIADTPEDFATKILRLSRDQELWNRIAAAGRIRVRNEWSPEVVESQLVAFLQRARAAVSGAN
jgi:glycosyltransferase involved in cell wall biosynthesis